MKPDLQIVTKILDEKPSYCVGDIIKFQTTISNPSLQDVTDARLHIGSNRDFYLVNGQLFPDGGGGPASWGAATNYFTVPAGQTIEPITYEFVVNNEFGTYTHTQSVTSKQTCKISYESKTTVKGSPSLLTPITGTTATSVGTINAYSVPFKQV